MWQFQSTPSTRRETRQRKDYHWGKEFQSTPSTRRETSQTGVKEMLYWISIHSLHTEGDRATRYYRLCDEYFNPLPPHGGRLNAVNVHILVGLFQSTPSTRRETSGSPGHCLFPCDFNPLPPHGGRPVSVPDCALYAYFNPLPPHGGRPAFYNAIYKSIFISIHSLHTEGDPPKAHRIPSNPSISIHSLHTEGDYTSYHLLCVVIDFNPLPPHGGRPCVPVHTHSS